MKAKHIPIYFCFLSLFCSGQVNNSNPLNPDSDLKTTHTLGIYQVFDKHTGLDASQLLKAYLNEMYVKIDGKEYVPILVNNPLQANISLSVIIDADSGILTLKVYKGKYKADVSFIPIDRFDNSIAWSLRNERNDAYFNARTIDGFFRTNVLQKIIATLKLEYQPQKNSSTLINKTVKLCTLNLRYYPRKNLTNYLPIYDHISNPIYAHNGFSTYWLNWGNPFNQPELKGVEKAALMNPYLLLFSKKARYTLTNATKDHDLTHSTEIDEESATQILNPRYVHDIGTASVYLWFVYGFDGSFIKKSPFFESRVSNSLKKFIRAQLFPFYHKPGITANYCEAAMDYEKSKDFNSALNQYKAAFESVSNVNTCVETKIYLYKLILQRMEDCAKESKQNKYSETMSFAKSIMELCSKDSNIIDLSGSYENIMSELANTIKTTEANIRQANVATGLTAFGAAMSGASSVSYTVAGNKTAADQQAQNAEYLAGKSVDVSIQAGDELARTTAKFREVNIQREIEVLPEYEDIILISGRTFLYALDNMKDHKLIMELLSRFASDKPYLQKLLSEYNGTDNKELFIKIHHYLNQLEISCWTSEGLGNTFKPLKNFEL